MALARIDRMVCCVYVCLVQLLSFVVLNVVRVVVPYGTVDLRQRDANDEGEYADDDDDDGGDNDNNKRTLQRRRRSDPASNYANIRCAFCCVVLICFV